MPDSAEQLQRLYLAGFELQTFERFPKCIGLMRDNCIALLVPGVDGLQILGAPGWRMGEVMGVLTEREGRQVFQAKSELWRPRRSGWRYSRGFAKTSHGCSEPRRDKAYLSVLEGDTGPAKSYLDF